MTTAQLLHSNRENRLYLALKENKDNYTIDSKGGITLKPEYAEKRLKAIIKQLKHIKVQAK